MKTEVVMKRELFGQEVSQKSKSEFFSATELVSAGNKWRGANGYSAFNLAMWLKGKGTAEFVQELNNKYGKAITTGRGKFAGTWVHPLLFIDLALAINPKLKIEVYEWLFDHLVKERNASGDSYKEMCGRLYVRHQNKREFPSFVAGVAHQIKNRCGVLDWQKATEEQLSLRNKIHYDIALLSDALNNNAEAVRLAMLRNE